MELILIRHGQAESNVIPSDEAIVGSDLPLTHEGERQSAMTARFLSALALQDMITVPPVLYASPYLRTRQTAAIIAAALEQEVRVDDRLQEVRKNDWSGMRVADVLPFEATLTREDKPYYRGHNGEDWQMIAERMTRFVLEREAAGDESVMVVSHDHPIECLIGTLSGTEISDWDEVHIKNASVTWLYKSGRLWQVDSTLFNVVPYE